MVHFKNIFEVEVPENSGILSEQLLAASKLFPSGNSRRETAGFRFGKQGIISRLYPDVIII
jgi:hypothetical protein